MTKIEKLLVIIAIEFALLLFFVCAAFLVRA